jgi:hypothetical protein
VAAARERDKVVEFEPGGFAAASARTHKRASAAIPRPDFASNRSGQMARAGSERVFCRRPARPRRRRSLLPFEMRYQQ